MSVRNDKCILSGYKKAANEVCDPLCPHRIAMHGLNGDGGRVGNAGLPKEYQYVTLSNSPVRATQAAVYELFDKYEKTFDRGDVKSMYLWSESPGTGKTTSAAALLNAWIARDYLTALKNGEQPRQNSGVFFDVNEFQTSYNLATMTNDDAAMSRIGTQLKRVQEAPFAVIDDIGVRGVTEAFRAYVHAVINHRVTNGLPTVYTSNLPMSELTDVFDERLYDRIRDQTGEIHFPGKSHRGRR